MDTKKEGAIPNEKNKEKANEKANENTAINKKGNIGDGREINHQVKDKREKHQPRDTA